MRERPVIDPQPEWSRGFQGWAAKFISRHRKYIDPIDGFDDCMTDAYLVFRRILATYPLVSDAANIMALFKVAMRNEYLDKIKAYKRKQHAEVCMDTLVAEDLKLIDTIGEENNEGPLRVLISEMRWELRATLGVLTDDAMMAKLREPQVQTKLMQLAGIEPKKETLNEQISRIIRLPKTVDLLGMLKSALTSK